MVLRHSFCSVLLSLFLCASASAAPVASCSITNPVGTVLRASDLAFCEFVDDGSRASANAGGGASLTYAAQLGAFNRLFTYQDIDAVTNMDDTGATVGSTFSAASVLLNQVIPVNLPLNNGGSNLGYIQFGQFLAYPPGTPSSQPGNLSVTLNASTGFSASVMCAANACAVPGYFQTGELVPLDLSSPIMILVDGSVTGATSLEQSEASSYATIQFGFRLFAADGVTPLPLVPTYPEPGTTGLVAAGLVLGCACWRRQRRS